MRRHMSPLARHSRAICTQTTEPAIKPTQVNIRRSARPSLTRQLLSVISPAGLRRWPLHRIRRNHDEEMLQGESVEAACTGPRTRATPRRPPVSPAPGSTDDGPGKRHLQREDAGAVTRSRRRCSTRSMPAPEAEPGGAAARGRLESRPHGLWLVTRGSAGLRPSGCAPSAVRSCRMPLPACALRQRPALPDAGAVGGNCGGVDVTGRRDGVRRSRGTAGPVRPVQVGPVRPGWSSHMVRAVRLVRSVRA